MSGQIVQKKTRLIASRRCKSGGGGGLEPCRFVISLECEESVIVVLRDRGYDLDLDGLVKGWMLWM